MTLKGRLYLSAAVVSIVGCFAFAQPRAETTVPIKKTDIGGVVTSPNGPEAGVWVIAETHDLPTRFAKMVVTDDQGRYVVPDLPKAKYTVWVRGYGLADSTRSKPSRASSSISKRCRRPMPRKRQKSIRRSTGIRC